MGRTPLLTVLLLTGLTARAAAPSGARWIWFPEGSPAAKAPGATRCFRGAVVLPAGAAVRSARLFLDIDDSGSVSVNGKPVASTRTGWTHIEIFGVSRLLAPGRNILAIEATNASEGPAGVLAWLDVRFRDGKRLVFVTDGTWKASQQKPPGWEGRDFDDSAWPQARELGPLGMAPWGRDLTRIGSGLALPIARRDGPVSAEEARKLVEADWLHQADGDTTPERSLQEVGWARELAARLNPEGFQAELAEMAGLERTLRSLAQDLFDEEPEKLYLAVRRVKRRIALGNPLLDFDRLLLVDTPDYAGVHESAHRNGYYYGPRAGSRLTALDGLRPDAGETVLLPPETGYIMRMDLSFDAKRIVFGMKPTADRSFHLYEVNVDGTGLRQLTNSAYDDMDPIYLPDEHILFSTSRGHTYVRCLPQSASTVLARCDADGRNIRILSRNNEPDYTPTLLPDGRVLYTRWEYTERPLWRLQKLWTVNPDGTNLAVYWGNGSAYPDMLWEARPIPGTERVMFAAVGHHNVVTGCIGILDTRLGLEFPDGIAKVTTEVPWPEVGNAKEPEPAASPKYHRSGAVWSYRCPWPLGPEDFLVAAAREANGRFDLFLMDIHGNRELLYVGRGNAWYARPLRPRAKPSAIPDRVAWPEPGEEPEPGVLFSPDVYRGVAGLPRGKAKFLRVIQMDAKTYSSGFKSWRHSGPVISVIQEDGVKRILGTAPVEPDGSVAVRVPAGKALHFQLLDEQQRCLQVMRSFTGVMPGETRGCLGCHGMHSVSPAARAQPLALSRPPVDLTPPPWGADVSVSYERFCQPILDQYCGRCHQGDGKARAKLDLTLRGGVPERGVTDPKLLPFKEPYLTLVGRAWSTPLKARNGPGVGFAGCLNVEVGHRYGPLEPMTMLSSTSPLVRRAMSGKHHGVKIEGDDLLRLIAWVDCNCVYRGDEEVRQLPDPAPEVARAFAVPPRIRTAPRIQRLQPVNDPMPR